MFYVYVEIWYKKQLEKIHAGFMDKLTSVFVQTVADNGGEMLKKGTGFFIGFDENSLGYLFGISRTLLAVQEMFEKNIEYIGEYNILADVSPLPQDDVYEKLRNAAEKSVTERNVLCFPAAVSALHEYLVFGDGNPAIVIGPVAETMKGTENGRVSPSVRNAEMFPLTGLSSGNLAFVLRNCLGLLPLNEIKAHFTDEERQTVSTLENSVKTYERLRFLSFMPEYVKTGFFEYCRLYIKITYSLMRSEGHALSFYPGADGPFLPELKEELVRVCAPAAVCGHSPFGDAGSSCTSTEAVEKAGAIPRDLADIAYLLARSSDFLFSDEMYEFFSFLGKKNSYVDSAVNYLRRCGVLTPEQKTPVMPAVFRQAVTEVLGSRTGILDRFLGNFMWEKYTKGGFDASMELYKVLVSLNRQVPESFLLSCLYFYLEIQCRLPSDGESAVPEHQEKKARDFLRCRALNLSGSSLAGSEIARYVAEYSGGGDLLECAVLLECGKWYYSQGRLSEASDLAKKALQKFQREKNAQGEYRSFALLALVNLAQSDISDSAVYFEYAAEGAERNGDRLYFVKARYNLAVICFVEGNYSRCLRLLEAVFEDAAVLPVREWEVLMCFLKGRCLLELGSYVQAAADFENGCARASSAGLSAAQDLCRVWYGRALACQGDGRRAQEIFDMYRGRCPDAVLFCVENALINDCSPVSEEEVEWAVQQYEFLPVWDMDCVSWTSGFRFAEDRCLVCGEQRSIGIRLLKAYYEFYRICVRTEADTEEACAVLFSFTRDDFFLETDPYNYLYVFLMYIAGSCMEQVNSLDRTTLLSKAFKLLQKRANHIDEIGIRSDFLQKSVWTRRLYDEARKNMLI